MQKKVQKICFHFEIIAFELVALNTRFYTERTLFIGCEYVNKQSQDSDTTKTEFSELIFFQSDQKISQKYCREELSSVLEPLTY